MSPMNQSTTELKMKRKDYCEQINDVYIIELS